MSTPPLHFRDSGEDDNAEIRLFEEAVVIPDAKDRRAFLEKECGGDSRLFERLLVLLKSHESGTSMAFPTWSSPLGDLSPSPAAGGADLQPIEGSAGGNVDTVVDKYRIVRRIGEGGCGTVYLADQERPVRRQVALKVIKPGMDSRQVIARFELERQTLAILEHPNIARILDAGTTDAGRPFFVMEYVRGERITEYCDRHRLGVRERITLFIDVCQAVQHAHQKGVIHRDLKPSNILVTEDGGTGIPKVIDFGIAKAVGTVNPEATLQTEVDQLLGTPAYMSPEQAQGGGGSIDTRSDIYSLGVLLYELLVGETPFDSRELTRKGFEAIRREILEVEPTRPSRRLAASSPERLGELARARSTNAPRLLQEARRDLDWIVMKALEKDRARRYPTANGLASDLGRHLANEVVLARPPSATYRIHKAYQRNRAGMLAGAVTILAVVVALIVSLAMYGREVRSRSTAEHLLARSEVEGGWSKWSAGDFQGAMAAFTEALRLDSVDPRRERLHRVRLAAVAQSKPRLAFSWSAGRPVTAAAFRPDGRRVFLATDAPGHPGVGQVWDVEQGQPVSAPLEQRATIRVVRFSRDGHRILTASRDGHVRVWDAESGAPISPVLDLGQSVDFAEFSPDGELVFAGSGSGRDAANGVLGLWEVRDGKSRLRESEPGATFVTATFSPDGHWIACGSKTYATLLIPSDGGDMVGVPDCWRAMALDFSPDGQRLLVAGAFGSNGERVGAQVLDVATRKYVSSLATHTIEPAAARFAPDGRRFASGGVDQTLLISRTDSQLPSGQRWVNHATVERLAFSADSRLVAAVCGDHCIRTWHVAAGCQFMSPLPHAGLVFDAVFSPDGREIRSVSGDGSVNAWLVREAFPPGIEYRQDSPVEAIVPGGGAGLLIADRTGFSVLDPENGRLRKRYERPTRSQWLRIAPVDGGFLLNFDAGMYYIDGQTGQARLETPGYSSRHDRIEVFPDGRKALRGYLGRTEAVAFEIRTGRDVQHYRAPGPISALSLTPDGRQLVGFGTARRFFVWDSGTGDLLRTGQHGGAEGDAVRLDFAPDGHHLLATMGVGLPPELHEFERLADGREPTALSSGIGRSVLSADGQWIASADAVGVVSIRRTDDPQRIRECLGHRGRVEGIEFGEENALLFTSSSDGTAAVWDTETGLMVVPPIVREFETAPVAYDSAHSRLWAAGGTGELKAWLFVQDRRSLAELRQAYGASQVDHHWDPGEAWRGYRNTAPQKAVKAP